MQLTKGAIGNLINRYKAVLKKCHLMNTFGSLAVAGMLIMGGAGMAVAANNDQALGVGGTYNATETVNHLVGGELYKTNTPTSGKTVAHDITLSVEGGSISEIIGGSYISGTNTSYPNATHGTITTIISGETTSAEFVVGGSKIANSDKARLETGKTSLTIKGGTFGTTDKNNYELVMGGNYVKTGTAASGTATTEGSSVTVDGGTFHASVVGGSVAHRYNGTGVSTVTDNGNTSVTITGGTFKPSESSLTDGQGGINLKAAVIGGGLAYGANTSSVLGSDTQDVTSSVTISGEETSINGKVVAGSVVANDGYSAIVHGDTLLSMNGGTVSDDLVGGGMVQDAGALTTAENQPSHNLIVTGDSSVTVTSGTAKGEIVGGNYVRGNGSARVENSAVSITGGEFATASDSTNKAQYVIGGNKSMAYADDTATTLVEKDSSVFVNGDVTIADGAVVGGSMAKATITGKATATVAGNSSVTVNNATSLAGVVGGGLAETYSHTGEGFATSEVTGTSSVAINGGTINKVKFGAVAGNTSTLSAAVVGGGLANDAGSTATVGSTSVTIADGTINGKVVAGGAAVNGGRSTVTRDTSLTMTGGKVDGDLIGGGFVDMNNAENNQANVGGSTHITVSGGSLVDAEIIGGGSVRNATGTANVTGDTYVTVTKYDNSQDKQEWGQYVLGGGKAMTNDKQTATANVTGSTNVTIGEQGATGDLDIKFGTVAGGGLARAQEGEGSATATVDNANVTVHSGILSGVAGGGIAENYGNGTATANVTGAAALTINGGTINGVKYRDVKDSKVAVLGGGITKGTGATASISGTTNTVINDGTINGHVVAGGLADGGIATVDTANLTIKGGEINGSVYAGGAALNSGMADVTAFDVRITGGAITGDVVAGNYTGEKDTPVLDALQTTMLKGAASKGSTITIGGDTKIGGKVDASAGGVATNVVIDGAGATVTGGYEGNNSSTLTFNNYNATFNNTATGFGTLSVAEGSNVQMDNLSTGTKGQDDKGFFGDGSNVDVTGKGTVTATNVSVANNTLTVTDGSTLDAKTLTTTGSGKAKTDGLGSTLVIGNTGEKALESIHDGSLSSTAGSEIKFTGLGDSVAANNISSKLEQNSTGIVNVGDTKVEGLRAENGKVNYTDWSTGGITNNELKKATLTGVNEDVNKIGSFGSAELDESIDTLTVNNSLTLTGLDDSNNFVSTSGDEKAGATIGSNATLTLGDNAYAGNKGIGAITIGNDAKLNVLGQSAAAATVNSGAITATANSATVNAKNVTLNVAGDIGADTQAISTIIADAANIKATGDVTAGDIDLVKGGSVTSDKNITVNGSIEDDDGTLQAGGNITVQNDITKAGNGKLTVAAGGTIEAANISATNVAAKKLMASGDVAVDGGVLNLTGTDAADASTVKSLKLTNGTQASIAGSLQLGSGETLTVGTGDDTVGGTTLSAQHINLADGKLLVDPDWGLASSNVAVESMGSGGTTDVVLNGNVGVGRNSYLALGTKDTGWLPGVVGNYTKGVGLSETGITAALGVFKGIEIDTGKNLTVDGSKTGTAISSGWTTAGGLPVTNTAEFANNSLLVVNGADADIAAGNAAISFKTPGTLSVAEGAKLLVTDAVAGQDYTIVANAAAVQYGTSTPIVNGGTVWKTEGLSTTTDMISLGDAVFTPSSAGTPDKVTTSAVRNDAHTVFPNLSDGMANAVNDLYTGHAGAAGKPRWDYADVNSADMGVRFLSRATDNRFLGMDKEAAAESIESAARIAFAGAVPQMTKMASDAGTNAVVNRLGFANPADGAQAMDAEGKIVDRNTTGFALWIAPLWQSQHGWGMDAGNMDYGFNGNLGGVSLGADYTFENALRAGITFNIGGGYAESSGGDLSSTDNRMNFWGLGAYAGWNYENFGVMADVSYTSTWNDLKQDVDSRMGMGDLEADVQATAISAGLRAEYLLQTSAMDIIPHIGVRYMSLNTWGYDVDTHGGTVLEGDSLHQDIWTFPIGVTFSKDFALDSGWNFKPSLDFSVIPAAGDIKAKHDVHFTGLPGTYEVETQMMDYLTWQGGVGLELANDNMSIGVNYTLQAGQHTTGHGVFGSFRYEF